jgi:photosystem II stability/assembly factor-like uncharacterized protein
MTKGVCSLVVALAVAVVGCTSVPTATAPKPSPSPLKVAPPVSSPAVEELISLRMTSLSVMWASTSRRILRSTDAGRHWSNVTPPAAPAQSPPVFVAVDDGAAWAEYTPTFPAPVANGGPYDVFRTGDGGATWAHGAGTLARGAITGIDFVDRTHGWATVGMGAAAGSEGIGVLRSEDGGASWSLIAQSADPITGQPDPSGLAFSCDKGWVTFGSASVGLIANICAGGPPTIYRSGDGGSHWSLVSLPTLGAAQIGFGNPTFLTALDAVLPGTTYGDQATPVVAVTHDGGVTWRALKLPAAGSVDFESTTSGWLLGSPIWATSDGGASWRALSAPAPPFKAVDMQLQDLGKGIATAWMYGAAYRTDDGAKTWRNVTPPLVAS